MHITRALPLLLCTFIYTHNAYGMLVKPCAKVAKIAKAATFCSTEPYIETVKYFNASEERKKAYQHWCPTPINWQDKNPHSILTNEISAQSKEDLMKFYKQFEK
jgi:hypothetical protein